eukprot:29300-Eustigmatos_ZCMA.PRE.1
MEHMSAVSLSPCSLLFVSKKHRHRHRHRHAHLADVPYTRDTDIPRTRTYTHIQGTGNLGSLKGDQLREHHRSGKMESPLK